MTSTSANEHDSPSCDDSPGAPSFTELLAHRWAEHVDPPPVRDVFADVGFVPNAGRQATFLDATEWDVGYGGAAGGGKTVALLMLGIRACERHPGIQVWCFRRSYPELRDSLLRELANYAYAAAVGAVWKASTNDLEFANGSVMRFRYCENLADASRYQGAEIQLLILDERTLVAPEVVDFLYTRVRSGRASIPVLGVRSGTNPGGIGHAAFKSRYVDATNHGEQSYIDARGRSVRFIPARISDNPCLNPEYEADLEAIADPALRAALKDGSWDTFAGQVFSEWAHDRHVVPTFTPPASWQRYAGIDWGYAAPHAVLHVATDDGRAWVYRERYGTQTAERDLALAVLEDEGALTPDGQISRTPAESVRLRLADPSMWNKVADANPIAQTFIAAGCAVIKATNDRLAGVQRVHSYLGDGPACALHRKMGWERCPLLHVMECCPNLIRTLPALPYDAHKPEDVDTDAEDHAYDALRYALMQLPLPRFSREPKAEASSVQDRIAAQLAERSRRRRNPHFIGA